LVFYTRGGCPRGRRGRRGGGGGYLPSALRFVGRCSKNRSVSVGQTVPGVVIGCPPDHDPVGLSALVGVAVDCGSFVAALHDAVQAEI
jgi:hypothetical protein